MLKNLSPAAVVIGASKVKLLKTVKTSLSANEENSHVELNMAICKAKMSI